MIRVQDSDRLELTRSTWARNRPCSTLMGLGSCGRARVKRRPEDSQLSPPCGLDYEVGLLVSVRHSDTLRPRWVRASG